MLPSTIFLKPDPKNGFTFKILEDLKVTIEDKTTRHNKKNAILENLDNTFKPLIEAKQLTATSNITTLKCGIKYKLYALN